MLLTEGMKDTFKTAGRLSAFIARDVVDFEFLGRVVLLVLVWSCVRYGSMCSCGVLLSSLSPLVVIRD